MKIYHYYPQRMGIGRNHLSYVDVVYPDITQLEEFKAAKKILVVSGDSWTNRVEGRANHSHTWVNEFADMRDYDFVILSANCGDSSTESFINLVNLFSQTDLAGDIFHNSHPSWLGVNVFEGKQVDVIVQWTSIIRDFSEFSAWYKPYTFASSPLLDDPFKKEMYDEYVMHILNDKFYSYKMQVYSWQLQKYFERWNIPYYFWMGFCDLVPESVENTDMDIRQYLNKDRWFNLYDRPGNMSDYLYYVEKGTLPNRLSGILTEGGPSAFLSTVSNAVNNLFNKHKVNTSLENSLFLADLHPSKAGNSVIAKTLHERF